MDANRIDRCGYTRRVGEPRMNCGPPSALMRNPLYIDDGYSNRTVNVCRGCRCDQPKVTGTAGRDRRRVAWKCCYQNVITAFPATCGNARRGVWGPFVWPMRICDCAHMSIVVTQGTGCGSRKLLMSSTGLNVAAGHGNITHTPQPPHGIDSCDRCGADMCFTHLVTSDPPAAPCGRIGDNTREEELP